jgi:hypothetical protein
MHHLAKEQIPAPLADEETARAVFSRAHERLERHFQSVVAQDLLYPWAARRPGEAASGRIQKELAEAEETRPPCNRDLEPGGSGGGEPSASGAQVEATRSKRAP